MSSSFTTITVPVCSQCIPKGNCCTFQTTACLPVPARPVLTVDELIESDPFAQVLRVMCTHGYLWNPCCGPVGSTNVGFTLPGLLAELEEVFPDASWNETDLESVLANGIASGLFKTNPSEGTYFANQNLLNVNPKNWMYEDICTQFCRKKPCRAQPSSILASCV